MVDWAAYLEALAAELRFRQVSEPKPSDGLASDSAGTTQIATASLLLHRVPQLLAAYLAQTASASLTKTGINPEAIVTAAGRTMAEQARSAGLSLSAGLAEQSRVRNVLMDIAIRVFPAEALFGPLQELLRFSDGILAGLVDEWSRLKSLNHRRRHLEARRYILREMRRYATVFRRMEEPAFVVDGQLRLLDVNPAFEKFFDLNARDCLGTTCMTAIEHGFCSVCPLAEVVRQGGSFSGVEIELETTCPDVPSGREPRTVLMAGTALGEAGEDGGAIVVLQDITEQKRAETQLRRSEEKFRSLVENLPDVIWRADDQGRILFVSSNSQSILGLAAEEMTGSDRFTRVHPEDLPELRRAYAQLIETGRPYDRRYRFQRGDTSWIWLRERAAHSGEKQVEAHADGLCWEITEFVNVEEELEEYRSWLEDMVDERTEELSSINRKLKREICERRRVERELIRMTSSLKQSNAELEQFAYVASHDLKEPLILITAFSQRLGRRYGSLLDERGREYLGRVIKAAGQLTELIEALLQLSRVSTSDRPFERLELRRVAQEVLDDLAERISSTGARVEVVDLPELNGDAVQIRQLLQNIIVNALKYRRREAAPEVSISGRMVGEDLCEITIADNGIGLEPDAVEKIFEPFVRLHGGGVLEGSGMGLTICKKIVARHGGEIKAVSRPGQGAVFVIRLPLRQPVPFQAV